MSTSAIRPPEELDERYPELARVAATPRRRRRIPFLQQMATTECGAACLAMVLGYHGRHVTVEEVVSVTGGSRDGASILQLMYAARWFGLRARGVQLDVSELSLLDPGTILHWEFKHFVVFERVDKGVVHIVDPAHGRRRIALDDFRRSFTGVALLAEPSDRFEPRERGARPIWTYLGQTLSRSGSWVRIVVTSLLLQLFALALPMLTRLVVDGIVPRGEQRLLVVSAAGLAALVGFHFVATMVRAHLLLHLRTHFDSRMTLGFIDHLLELRYAFFQQRPTGDLMNRINSNATIREMLTSGTLSALIDGTFVLGYLSILSVASPGLALVCLLLALAQVAVFLLSWSRQRDLMVESLRAQSASESYLVEMLSGIETLKASGTELRAAERWSSLFVDQLNVSLSRGKINALVDALASTLRLGSPLVLLCCGAAWVLDHSLSLGAMLAALALAQGLLSPVASLVASASQLTLLGGYLERIEDVLLAPAEQPRDSAQPAPPLSGRVSVEGVSFRYAPTAPEVVREVSVDIPPGAFVAVVGRSGSGKSTLASLLLGLYPPASGRIVYDGHDLGSLDLRSVRRQLGIVTQRSYLFATSIRANIAQADPSLPMERVIEAARCAGIHDEIMAMPMKYNTLLSDGGASLSGGQRQRIALARALAINPAVLLLDEATSALDAVSERVVQDRVAALGCTRIVIAHRLSTIRRADLILVMDGGRIVERGTHAELVARGGHYAQLVSAQESARPDAAVA